MDSDNFFYLNQQDCNLVGLRKEKKGNKSGGSAFEVISLLLEILLRQNSYIKEKRKGM